MRCCCSSALLLGLLDSLQPAADGAALVHSCFAASTAQKPAHNQPVYAGVRCVLLAPLQYASRLQEELAKPGTSGGGRSTNSGSTPGSSGPPTQQQQQSPPLHDQQQQQPRSQQQSPTQHVHHQQQGQQTESASSPAGPTASAAAAAAAASAALPRSSTPGEGQGERSMAGRVLLLGRSQARRVSSASSRTPPGAAGSNVFSGDSAPTGCGVPRSLAPNEVEDLSRLAAASKVAPIRTQGSITPQLWDVVFGAARSPPASGSRRALHYQQQQDAAEAFTSNAALPRIKTRPLGEAREQQCSFNGCRDCSNASATGCRCSCQQSSIPPAASQASSSRSNQRGRWHALQQHGSRWLPCLLQHPSSPASPSQPGSAAAMQAAAATAAAAIVHAAAAKAADLPCQGMQQHRSSSSSKSAAAAAAGPLGEGLDRTGSLLNRTSSVASSAAGRLGSITNSSNLGRASSVSRPQQQQAQPHAAAPLADGGGSGNFGASLARRASAAGEAVSRSLEADREGLMAGWIADDASAEAAAGEGAPARRL